MLCCEAVEGSPDPPHGGYWEHITQNKNEYSRILQYIIINNNHNHNHNIYAPELITNKLTNE